MKEGESVSLLLKRKMRILHGCCLTADDVIFLNHEKRSKEHEIELNN